MEHPESLHLYAVSPHPQTLDAALAACHRHLNAGTPCAAPARPHDLALLMFTEVADNEWHLADSKWRRNLCLLFDRYVAGGYIAVNEPVAAATALKYQGCAITPLYPLQLAVRRDSVPTAIALVRAGALDAVGASAIEPLVQEHSDEQHAPFMLAALLRAYIERAGHRCCTLDLPLAARPAYAQARAT